MVEVSRLTPMITIVHPINHTDTYFLPFDISLQSRNFSEFTLMLCSFFKARKVKVSAYFVIKIL